MSVAYWNAAELDSRSGACSICLLWQEYDESGFPTEMADGQPVSKGMVKKLQKALEAQKKAHEGWLATQQGQNGGPPAGGEEEEKSR